MFSSLGYSESPLFAEFRRLEQQFDELFGAWTPWAGGIRSLPAGTFPAINVASNPDSFVYVVAARRTPVSMRVGAISQLNASRLMVL
jgi:HSP20 family protein